MSRISSLIFSILLVIFFIVIPAIPGAVLWWHLKPVLFWEKFAWVVTSMMFYIIIIAFIGRSMSDSIYKEGDEEEIMEEDEK
jgi:hypothetical protein